MTTRAVRIDTLEDPRIDDFRNIRDAELVRRRGIFIAESPLVVQRLIVESSYATRSVFVERRRLEAMQDALQRLPADTPVFTADQSVMNGIVGYPIHRGVLAAGEIGAPRTIESVAANAQTLVVLERLVNTDNVGSIFRSATALGADGVLLDPSCADPLYRQSVRVSIGTALTLPWARATEWPGALEALRDSGFVLAGLTPGGDTGIGRFDRPERLALLAGTEGEGLTQTALNACQVKLQIEMAHGVDSLNVSTATAVALHTLRKPRAARAP